MWRAHIGLGVLGLLSMSCEAHTDAVPDRPDGEVSLSWGDDAGRDAEAPGPVDSGASDSGSEPPVASPLCDGSDAIRLAFVMGGGYEDPDYWLTTPYGHSFLYVNGHCEYVTGGSLADGISEGRLDVEQASEAAQRLRLAELPRWSGHRDLSCPDAPIVYLRSADGYGECSCDCDDTAPRGLAEVLDAASKLRGELQASAIRTTGPVQVVAVVRERSPTFIYQAWPFDFAAAEISVPPERLWNTFNDPLPLRELDGTDAVTARALRDNARSTSPIGRSVVPIETAEGTFLDLYVLDQMPSPFADQVAAFPGAAQD